MIKNLTDKDLNFKISDLLEITRKLAKINFNHKEFKFLNPYFKDIELIIFTLFMEQIQEYSEKQNELMEKNGLTYYDIATKKTRTIKPKQK